MKNSSKKSKVSKSQIAPEIQKSIESQFAEYAAGKRKKFDLKALQIHSDLRELKGTPLQKSVWQELLRIPYGKTLTYSELAEKVGNAKAVRAVASAVARNPLCIVIPCHRILPKAGTKPTTTTVLKEVGNYALGSELKRTLLEIEGAI